MKFGRDARAPKVSIRRGTCGRRGMKNCGGVGRGAGGIR
jgi:hypothetical protein